MTEFNANPDVRVTPSKVTPIGDLPDDLSKPLQSFLEKHPEAMTISTEGTMMIDMAAFKAFSTGVVVGVAISIVTGQVLEEISKYTHMSKDGTMYMELGVNMAIAGGIIAADPTSVWGWVYLASSPVQLFVDYLKEPERRKKINDDPEYVYGSRFGKVRSIDPKTGKATWYPAIYSSKEFKSGHGDDIGVRMTYGDAKDMMWRALPDGTFKPFFREGTWRIKNFNVKKYDVDPSTGGSKDWVDKNDPLRDYYLFTDADTKTMFESIVQGKPPSQLTTEVDDNSKRPLYYQKITNLRNSIEFIENYIKGSDKLAVNLYPADRGLRRAYWKTHHVDTGVHFSWTDALNANYADPNISDADLKKGAIGRDENKYLLEYFKNITTDLIRTQQQLADNTKGFKDAMLTVGDMGYLKRPVFQYSYARQLNLDVNQPPAKTSLELRDQLSAVKSTSPWEQHYKEMKLIARHLMYQINAQGLEGYVVHDAFKPDIETPEELQKQKKEGDFVGMGRWMGLSDPANFGKSAGSGNSLAIEGVPRAIWSDSYESNIPAWFSPDIQDSWDVKQWNQQTLQNREVVWAGVPQSELKGITGLEHFVSNQKNTKLNDINKRTRLNTIKQGRKRADLIKHPIIKATGPKATADITNRNDAYYDTNPDFSWEPFLGHFVKITKFVIHNPNAKKDLATDKMQEKYADDKKAKAKAKAKADQKEYIDAFIMKPKKDPNTVLSKAPPTQPQQHIPLPVAPSRAPAPPTPPPSPKKTTPKPPSQKPLPTQQKPTQPTPPPTQPQKPTAMTAFQKYMLEQHNIQGKTAAPSFMAISKSLFGDKTKTPGFTQVVFKGLTHLGYHADRIQPKYPSVKKISTIAAKLIPTKA